MKRSKWLAIRETPRNLWRRLGRYVCSGGTYVRPRSDFAENARLQRFAGVCNGNWRERQKKLREKKAQH